MSNYPNMSYCMCENTLLALRQVLNAMQEEGPMFLQEMSRDERRAFDARRASITKLAARLADD